MIRYIIQFLLVATFLATAFAIASPSAADASSTAKIGRVQNISENSALWHCELSEAFNPVWHCETWYGGDCIRPFLLKPNFVACNPDYVLDAWDGKHSKACARKALYFSGDHNQFKPKITWRKSGIPKRYRTTNYHCQTYNGLGGGD